MKRYRAYASSRERDIDHTTLLNDLCSVRKRDRREVCALAAGQEVFPFSAGVGCPNVLCNALIGFYGCAAWVVELTVDTGTDKNRVGADLQECFCVHASH